MTDVFAQMEASGGRRVLLLDDPSSGLKAIIALDDLSAGPACGGVRTRAYPDVGAAIADAVALARAMTLKCAIANLPAGGGKTVVLDHAGMNRVAAFGRLGAFIEDLGGLYRCAGDLGTTQEDLLRIAEQTRHVNTTGVRLGEMTARTVVNCMRACAQARGRGGLDGLRVAVQGCGLIGASVARAVTAEGARVFVADVDGGAASRLGEELNAIVVDARDVLSMEVDMVSPCAIGGVVTVAVADAMKAWAICGGANNQLASPEAGRLLHARGVTFMPDFLASSGAVIDGVCAAILSIAPDGLLAQTEQTAREVLAASAREFIPPEDAARAIALTRVDLARQQRMQ